MYKILHFNFYTGQNFKVYDLLCLINHCINYVRQDEYNYFLLKLRLTILTQSMEMVNVMHVLNAKSSKILL